MLVNTCNKHDNFSPCHEGSVEEEGQGVVRYVIWREMVMVALCIYLIYIIIIVTIGPLIDETESKSCCKVFIR